jgi:hypothetical protein
MRKEIRSLALTAATAWLAVGVAAAQAPQTPPASSSAAKSITVSGCIEKAATGTTGTTGASGAMADETKFVLKNAMASSSAAGTTAGTAGTASEATAVAKEYRLDADEAKLSPHVGHKVEITGTPAKPAGAAESSAASAPKLKVDNVKMVSTTCP